MHVAILFEFSSLNGGEHSTLAVLQALADDHSVRFSAIAPPHGPLAERLNALRIPLVPLTIRSTEGTRRDDESLRRDIIKIVTDLRPTLLHANSLSMSRLAGRLTPGLPDSIPCTGHLRDILRLTAAAVRDLNRLDSLVAVSQATRGFHVSQGLDANRCEVIYNGVDCNRFRPRPSATARAKVLPEIPAGARVLLNIGQISLRKGQDDLAHAVIQIPESRHDVHLVLIGQRHSNKEESRHYDRSIDEAFRRAGRADQLHRRSSVDDIPTWMNAADLLVHSARQEPLGRVLLEAAASELPVIATNVGGTREIFPGDDDALLVPAGDVSALAAAIAAALKDPPAGRQRARNAAEMIATRFDIAAAAARLRNFWQRTAG